MARTLKVFISSTSSDLEEHRRAVSDALKRLDQLSVDMKFFAALPGAPLAECRRLVADSDAVVVIVAHRYGWVPSQEEGGDGKKSVTWHEIDTALGVDKPLFTFLVDPGYPWTLAKEQDRLVEAQTLDEVEKIARAVWGLRDFKKALGGMAVRDLFSTPDDLAAKVTASIAKWLLRTGALRNASQAYGLLVLEIAQEHRYLNPEGDFRITSTYRVLNTSNRGVSALLPDATSFLVVDPEALETTTTIECAIRETSAGPATIAIEQKSFNPVRTQKIDGQDRPLTRVSWRPKISPALRPGSPLTYTCTVETRGTEQAAFSAGGTFAGIASPYPVNCLAFACHAPPGYRIDRPHFKTFLRTEDGDSPVIDNLPAPVFESDDRVVTWVFEGDVVQILVNYLVQLRFVAS